MLRENPLPLPLLLALTALRAAAGWGAVTKTAKVKAGSTVAVFGLGVIGLAVVEVRTSLLLME